MTPFSLDEPVVPVRNAKLLCEAVANLGKQPTPLLAAAGLEPTRLETPRARMTRRQYIALLRALARTDLPPDFGLRAGEQFSIAGYGMLGYAMMSSATLEQAIRIAMRFYRTAGPLFELRYRVDDDRIIVETHDVLHLDSLYPFVVEQLFSGFPPLLRLLLGRDVWPLAVRLSYPAPSHAKDYEERFRCPIEFDCEHTQYLIDAVHLSSPLVQADADTAKLFEQSCRALLDEIEQRESLAGTISRILLRSPGVAPTADEMARRLNLGPRTMRRRLRELGTCYQQILDDVRCRLAIDYLETTELTSQEIAELLGYTEATNFRRAFLKWTGKSPSDYRARSRLRARAGSARTP